MHRFEFDERLRGDNFGKTKDKSHKTKGVRGSRFKVQEPLQLEIAICDLKILTSSLVSININDGEKKRKLDQASAPSVTW